MRTLTLRNRFQGNSTIVENDFIDHYMAKANGEYVKVYLLLLRHLNTPDTSLTISKLADNLDCTEKDIVRALKYWSNAGLLMIDYDDAGTICGLAVGKGSASAEAPLETEVDLKVEVPVETEMPKPTAFPRSNSSEHQEELKQLYFVIEQYFKKPLSYSDIQKVNYFFDTLNFSTDLIEYLIESCVENGHRSMHYIEKVALRWFNDNITTVTEAKTMAAVYNKNYFGVLKAFGISGRNPAPIEITYIKKWMEEYGFTLDVITEACNRTIAKLAKPDFKYADSILSSWYKGGVHHVPDIKRLDLARRQEKAAKKQVSQKSVSITNNRFNNFEGRSYDISSLEQQLLNTR